MPFKAFSIANLASPEIRPEFDEPWLTAPAIPSFPDREAYKRWMAEPTSVVPLFSLIEGENPITRVSALNSPYRVHGIVTDYDSPLTDAEVAAGLKRIPAQFPPFAWNRTRRGGVRVVWAFEHPVFYYGDDAFKRLMHRAKKELRLSSLFPGLDEEILDKPDQCYAAGNGWTVNAAAHIRSETLNLWLFDVLRKTSDFDREVEIPLDVVKAEMEKRFPGRWKGEFTEGARGLRFWDPTADNETATIVRKTGMTAFTGDRGFLSWSDIFGREFVTKYQEDRIGRAVGDMYCDGEKNYYRLLPNGTWDLCATDVTRRHLKGRYGLSDSVRKGERLSEVDQVLHHLELNRRIEGALPFPHRPEQVVHWNGTDYLNTAQCKLVRPSGKAGVIWGLTFPFLAVVLTTLFKDEKTLAVVLAWLKVTYESCLRGEPQRGQALFIMGPPGTGKTFFSLEILGSIFGGYADARNYFVEGARFNSSMFDRFIWSLDDSTILGDRKQHAKFSSLIKAVVANPSMSYERKYGYSGSCPFTGRFVCTLNDDPVSLGILPDTDQSLLDKAILVQTDEVPAQVTDNARVNHETVMAELPDFLQWLTEWEIPEWIERDPRFGIKAWHDERLLAEAQSTTESSATIEALQLFIDNYTPDKPGRPWEGTATELLGAMQSDDGLAAVTRGMTARWFGRQLRHAIATGVPWIQQGHRGIESAKRRVYRIFKPSDVPKTPESSHP